MPPCPRKQPAEQPDQFKFGFYTPSIITPQGDGGFTVRPGKPQSWLGVGQFATAVGLSRNTIYGHISSGLIPDDQIEYRGLRKIVIRADAIDTYRASCRARRTAG